LLSLALVNGLATADTYAHRTLLGAVPPHARRPLAVGADQHHIAGRDGPRPLDHTALGVGARRAHVPLLDVDAFHDNPVLAGPRFEHPAGLALVVAADDHHQVILFHMHFDRFRQPLRAISCPPLQHFRSQGHDPHKIPLPQFPGHRPEDARPARVALLVDDDGSVLIKPDRGAVGPPHRLGGAHHHRLHDVALLDHAAGRGLFDRRHDHIADPRVAAAAAAQHANAQQLFGAGVVRHLEPRLLLNHCSRPPLLSPADDLNDAPALLLAQGTRLHDPDHVPGTAQVLLVVGLRPPGAAHSALVLRVDHHALDGDHHGFIHLVGDDRSDPGLAHAPLGFRHRQSLLVTPRTPSGGCSAPAPAGWCGYGRYPCAPPAPASG